MAVKKYKPVTPGTRGMTGHTFEEITKSKPERSLLVPLRKSGGRNSYGRVTVRHRGGGHRRFIRIVDFKRDKRDIPAKVAAIEYDPNRTARLALLELCRWREALHRCTARSQSWRYSHGWRRSRNPFWKFASRFRNIPVGTLIHNIEVKEGRGGQMVRSAGGAAQLLAKEGDFAQVRMPSGEVRLIHQVCYATIGQVGNLDHGNVKLGKAGRKRHKGIRPTVRGSAMSPRDHPHGGGEGRQPIGLPGPKSPWGKPTLGYKTRRNKKTDQYIVRRRSKTNR